MPFQHRFLRVLATFWRAKMTPKSIKNRLKLSFRAFLFPHRFLHRFFIDVSTNFDPLDVQKVYFSKRKQCFFIKLSFEDYIDFGLLVVPTCYHVGLQNRRFSEIMAFQEAFKISSFFVSIFYRFWVHVGLQHGPILGAKMARNSKNGSKILGCTLPKSVLNTILLLNIF